MNSERVELWAKIACAYGGAAWGLFWIPLRALNDSGVGGPWPTVLFFVVPTILFVPIFVRRWRPIFASGLRLHFICMVIGAAVAMYSNSMLYTEVVRAMLLYYMTPIWSLILARVWLGEKITPIRLLAIAIGVAGMLVILWSDAGFPWPRNLGDWIGLASGIIWAVGAVMMRETPDFHALDMTAAFLMWTAIAALIMAMMPFAPSPPVMSSVVSVLPWLIPATLVVIVPTFFAVMWGAPKLNPGVVGLLFLTEISVGAATAAVWANEPFGVRELTGILLITLAGIVEFVGPPLVRRLKRGAPAAQSKT